MAPSSPSTAKVQQSGNRAASRRSSRRGSSGRRRTPAGRGPGRPSPARRPRSAGRRRPPRSTSWPGRGRRRRSAAGGPASSSAELRGGHGARVDVADGGDPADAVPPADGDLGDDEDRRPADRVEGDAGEEDRTGAGDAERVVDVGGRRCSRPTRRRPRSARRARRPRAGRPRPQPTRPSPRRTQDSAPSAGSRSDQRRRVVVRPDGRDGRRAAASEEVRAAAVTAPA